MGGPQRPQGLNGFEDGLAQAHQRGLFLTLRRPVRDLLEIVHCSEHDAPKSLRCHQGDGPRRCTNRRLDVVIEEGHPTAYIVKLVTPSRLQRLHPVDPDLLHVVRVMLEHHLPHGIISLPVVANKHKPELRVQGEILLEARELLARERAHALPGVGVKDEGHPRIHRSREERRHGVKIVLLLHAAEALEELLLDHLADEVRPRGEGDELPRDRRVGLERVGRHAGLELPVESCHPRVGRVPRVALVNSSGPPTT
mmetsp:Transcript_58909/g.170380  ORF Transcript_58909/g.170380 Transcript_58909/m.170380 type:complete len:254 (-) Transcript_58909:2101-2862(-)